MAKSSCKVCPSSLVYFYTATCHMIMDQALCTYFSLSGERYPTSHPMGVRLYGCLFHNAHQKDGGMKIPMKRSEIRIGYLPIEINNHYQPKKGWLPLRNILFYLRLIKFWQPISLWMRTPK